MLSAKSFAPFLVLGFSLPAVQLQVVEAFVRNDRQVGHQDPIRIPEEDPPTMDALSTDFGEQTNMAQAVADEELNRDTPAMANVETAQNGLTTRVSEGEPDQYQPVAWRSTRPMPLPQRPLPPNCFCNGGGPERDLRDAPTKAGPVQAGRTTTGPRLLARPGPIDSTGMQFHLRSCKTSLAKPGQSKLVELPLLFGLLHPQFPPD